MSNTRGSLYLHLFRGLGTLEARAWMKNVKPEEPKHC